MLLTVIIGLVVGSAYGLTSMGLVLTYRTSGIFNLAHGAVGCAGSYAFYELWRQRGLPMGVALLLTLGIFAPALGATLYYGLFRRVTGKPIAVTLVASVAALVVLQGLVIAIYGSSPRRLGSLFPTRTFDVAGYALTLEQVGTGVLTAVLAFALLAFLQGTSFGLRTRGVVDNTELAKFTGENTESVQLGSWMIGTAVSCLAGILISQFIFLSPIGLTLIVIQAMAAAVLGRLVSLPMTYAGGLVLGILEKVLQQELPQTQVWQGLRISVTFIVLYLAVLIGSTFFKTFRSVGGGEGGVGGFLGREVDRSRLAPILVLYAGAFVALMTAGSYLRFLLMAGLVVSIALQGFVLITGLAGQVSLCQAALVGTGAVAFGRAVTDWDVPIVVAFGISALTSLAVGLAIALPSIRVRGLPLALLTLAFGLFMDSFLFKTEAFSGGFGGFQVPRFDLFGIDLGSDRSLAAFIFVVALGAAILVRNIGSGRTGRLLVAVRNAEVAAESFGTSVRRTKLFLFSLAAMLAGVAGAFNAVLLQTVSATDYTISLSLNYLTVAILGGVSGAQGALVGGIAMFVVPDLIGRLGFADYNSVVFGMGAVVVLIARQGGLADQLSRPIVTLAQTFRSGARLFASANPVAEDVRLPEPAMALAHAGNGGSAAARVRTDHLPEPVTTRRKRS